MSQATTLISCHVPKTAGTSFRGMLESRHRDRCVMVERMPRADVGAYQLLRNRYWYARSLDSHFFRSIDVADFWPGARFSIILRDPVERFLSYYFFRRHHTGLALRDPNEKATQRWLEANFPSIDRVLERLENYMTAFVACASFYAPLDSDALDVAVQNLRSYDLIGFAERSDALPALLAHEFPEFEAAAMPVENVTSRRKGHALWRDRVDSRTLARVRDRHALDLRLYEAAVRLNASRGHPTPP